MSIRQRREYICVCEPNQSLSYIFFLFRVFCVQFFSKNKYIYVRCCLSLNSDLIRLLPCTSLYIYIREIKNYDDSHLISSRSLYRCIFIFSVSVSTRSVLSLYIYIYITIFFFFVSCNVLCCFLSDGEHAKSSDHFGFFFILTLLPSVHVFYNDYSY